MAALRGAIALLWAAALIGHAGPLSAQAAEPAREPATLAEFAYAIEMTPAAGTALQSVLLPLEVYRGVTRGDLGDVRVFDAGSREVPHALSLLAPTAAAPQQVELPLYPVPQSVRDAAQLDVSLRVERSSDGAVVELHRPEPLAGAQAAAVAAYLLDARGLRAPIVALRVQLEPGGANYVARIGVEQSRDLAEFQRLPTRSDAIARMDYLGQHIEQDRVEVQATGPFLRLSVPEGHFPARVTAVRAELAAAEIAPPAQQLLVQGRRLQGEPGVYEFELGGALPIERVAVELPEENTLVQAQLEARASATSAFEQRFSGPLYRLAQPGGEVRSAPIELGGARRRSLRLRVAAAGGGLGAQLPSLRVEYVPDQLLFIARGSGPFQLAYGQHATRASTFSASELRAAAGVRAGTALAPQTVQLAQPRELAGQKALTPPPPAPPIKKYLLWTVLIAAACVVVALALRAIRQLE